MRRRLPWILALLLVLVVGGAIALVVIEKPALDDDRTAVDRRWDALRPALVDRYQKLDAALAAFVAAGGGDRAVAKDLRRALREWQAAVADGGAGAQAAAANGLEGAATRLRANVLGAPRLAASGDLLDAITTFTGSTPSRGLVRAYNQAVRTYQDARDALLKKPVAVVFGYGARPVLVIGPGPG
jgi:hypothetical protein